MYIICELYIKYTLELFDERAINYQLKVVCTVVYQAFQTYFMRLLQYFSNNTYSFLQACHHQDVHPVTASFND